MPPVDATALAAGRRVSLVAPAGCGKTQLIAAAIAQRTSSTDLVLTHTHAGVAALRLRMSKLGAKPAHSRIETIAGWALRYSAAYPTLSGLKTTRPDYDDWNKVYQSAVRLLSYRSIGSVVRASYSGVYVDEYQDCNEEQHKLVLALADLIPCRVVGDPLQGIFGFKGVPLINWERDVIPSFAPLPELSHPYRWATRNEALGRWLSSVRTALSRGEAIDLGTDPSVVTWIPSGQQESVTQRNAYFDRLKLTTDRQSLVVIHHNPKGWQEFARRSGGPISCVEAAVCPDLQTAAAAIENASGPNRALMVIEFAMKCMSNVSTPLSSIRTALDKGRTLDRIKVCPEQVARLTAVISDLTLAPVLPALKSILALAEVRVFRRELFDDMSRSLEQVGRGAYATLVDAVWQRREIARRQARRTPRIALGTTLLLKGLEFDHALVLNGDALDIQNLYVAMTRGSASLAVISKSRILRPRPVKQS